MSSIIYRSFTDYNIRLILESDEDTWYVGTSPQRRYDVAEVFSKQPYGFASGFLAKLYCGSLKQDKTYRLYIYMEHKYNPGKNRMIDTKKQITI